MESIERISDIIADGAGFEELRMNLAFNLIDYAQEYYKHFKPYYSSLNRCEM